MKCLKVRAGGLHKINSWANRNKVQELGSQTLSGKEGTGFRLSQPIAFVALLALPSLWEAQEGLQLRLGNLFRLTETAKARSVEGSALISGTSKLTKNRGSGLFNGERGHIKRGARKAIGIPKLSASGGTTTVYLAAKVTEGYVFSSTQTAI